MSLTCAAWSGSTTPSTTERTVMKRMIAGLGLTLASAVIAAGFAITANAATPGPPWVHSKDLPDPVPRNSAGY